jgi:hypothetical protein
MSGHWSSTFTTFLRKIVPEASDVPLYLLKQSESGAEWQSHWLALFGALADLKAQQTLERLGVWSGRGICIVVRDDFDVWSNRCRFGTLLHEMAHAIEFVAEGNAFPERSELSPVARELLGGRESEILQDAGICRSNLVREQHGAEFVRYAMHLYTRARQHIPLSPADVQCFDEAYALPPSKFEAVAHSLRSELAMSKNLNLLKLRPAPQDFLRLFR